jgi:hypothetical protein
MVGPLKFIAPEHDILHTEGICTSDPMVRNARMDTINPRRCVSRLCMSAPDYAMMRAHLIVQGGGFTASEIKPDDFKTGMNPVTTIRRMVMLSGSIVKE